MQLVELTIQGGDGSPIRAIQFRSGLNLILDAPVASEKRTGNNLGKTTVLRLIDYCFGSDGKDIWTDNEFGTVNQEVYEFLHASHGCLVQLDVARGAYTHTFRRRFVQGSQQVADKCSINGEQFRSIKAYKEKTRELLFGSAASKPTLRQLMPKFVRSSKDAMGGTLRYLNNYVTDIEYQAIHLFLFGFFDHETLRQLPATAQEIKIKSRDLEAIERDGGEGETEQLHRQVLREIGQLEEESRLTADIPELKEKADLVTRARSEAAGLLGELSEVRSSIVSIQLAVGDLSEKLEGIDARVVESVYEEAGRFFGDLHHSWEELSTFIRNLRQRKREFFEARIDELRERERHLVEEVDGARAREEDLLAATTRSPEFDAAVSISSHLREKYQEAGALKRKLADVRALKDKITELKARKEKLDAAVAQQKKHLADRISIFNGYFAELSKQLYDEKYLLHYKEKTDGTLVFQLKAVGENVGAGKKATQTAAFDLAYIQFLDEVGIGFPRFVCHDGVEAIHANQIKHLLNYVEDEDFDGQLVISTLRDKLPTTDSEFLKRCTVLELSQDDMLFRIASNGYSAS